jgi:hypothetical protein
VGGIVTDLPADPIGPFATVAMSIHQMMLEFLKAGFSDAQAYDLAKASLVASLMKGQQSQ